MPRLLDHTLGLGSSLLLQRKSPHPLPSASFSTEARTMWPTLPSSADLLGIESGSVLELHLHELLLVAL